MLRIFVGQRTAASHTSDVTATAVEQLVDETVEMAKLTSEDASVWTARIRHSAEWVS
jgi:predicted Zn-dependent protease